MFRNYFFPLAPGLVAIAGLAACVPDTDLSTMRATGGSDRTLVGIHNAPLGTICRYETADGVILHRNLNETVEIPSVYRGSIVICTTPDEAEYELTALKQVPVEAEGLASVVIDFPTGQGHSSYATRKGLVQDFFEGVVQLLVPAKVRNLGARRRI